METTNNKYRDPDRSARLRIFSDEFLEGLQRLATEHLGAAEEAYNASRSPAASRRIDELLVVVEMLATERQRRALLRAA